MFSLHFVKTGVVAGMATLLMPALAQAAVDAAGAQALQKDITTFLEYYPQLVLSGPVAVTPDGDAYAITVPESGFTLGRKGNHVVFSQVQARMTPVDEDKFRLVVTPATELGRVTDDAGLDVASITSREFQFSGEWSKAQASLLSSTLLLRGLTVSAPGKSFEIQIGEIGAVSSNQVQPDSTMDGQGSLNLRNLTLTHADKVRKQAVQIKLGALGVSSFYKGYDSGLAGRVRQQLGQMRELANRPGAKASTEWLGIVSNILASIPDNALKGSSQVSLVLNNLETTVALPKQRPFRMIVPLMKFGAGGETVAALSNARFSYQHKGLAAAPLPSRLLGEILPSDVHVEMAMDKLPVAKLLQETLAIVEKLQGSGQPEAKNLTAEQKRASLEEVKAVGRNVVALLEQAGSVLRLVHLDFAGRALSLTTVGELHPALSSPGYATGRLEGRISGITQMTARLEQLQNAAQAGGSPKAPQDPLLPFIGMGLSVLQANGREVGGAVPSQHIYNIEITPQGAVKLNGSVMFQVPKSGSGRATAQDEALPPRTKSVR